MTKRLHIPFIILTAFGLGMYCHSQKDDGERAHIRAAAEKQLDDLYAFHAGLGTAPDNFKQFDRYTGSDSASVLAKNYYRVLGGLSVRVTTSGSYGSKKHHFSQGILVRHGEDYCWGKVMSSNSRDWNKSNIHCSWE